MENDLSIRKDVSECQDPRHRRPHGSQVEGTEFPAGRQTSVRPYLEMNMEASKSKKVSPVAKVWVSKVS